MNITPIEIRQKEFERHFRGYDKDEVNAFLHTLSQAWERVLQENREKTTLLAKAEKDIEKVREVESSLFRTLRTAEDTGSEIIDKAQRTAEETLQQAELHKQEITDEAHARARAIVADAEQQAKAVVDGLRERVEHLRQEAEEAESRRQYALSQLQELAHRMLQQVDNAQPASANEAVIESEHALADLEAAHPPTSAESNDTLSPEAETYEAPDTYPDAPSEYQEPDEASYEPVWASSEPEPAPEPTPARLKRGSFFDDIE